MVGVEQIGMSRHLARCIACGVGASAQGHIARNTEGGGIAAAGGIVGFAAVGRVEDLCVWRRATEAHADRAA